jgi:hypothetical protein
MYVANTWLSPSKNYSIRRNGTFFSANSLGPLNNVKITDLSGNVPTGGAKVIVSAWDSAGTKLAQVSGLVPLVVNNHQTVTVSGDQFAAMFVGTPMSYSVVVQSTHSTVSNVKKSADGITSTVWANTVGGGAL